MKKYVIVLLIIISFSCGIKKRSNKELSSNKYELVILDSLIIRTEASSVCSNDSLIFISERYAKKISCYDYEGKKRFSIGGQGSGPGEFIGTPSCITIFQNFVVAADIPEFEIEFFNFDGTHCRTFSYIEQMITPVSNILGIDNNLVIEGLSLKLEGDTALLHKVIRIDNEYYIKEESVTILRKLVSFDDLFKKLNPFELDRLYFPLNNKTAKIITPNLLRIYNENDSTDLSLESIPLVKVNQNVINNISKSFELPGFKLKFPDFLPKINNVFMINDKILVLSEEQNIDNKMNKSKNEMYLYEKDNNSFIKVKFPVIIPVSKISNIYKSIIFLLFDDKLKIIRCDFD